MSARFIGRASILVLALGLTALSASAEARIVIEPRTGPGAVAVVPGAGQWVPGARFQGSVLPSLIAMPLIAMPLGCDTRADSLLRARIDRLVQRQQLDHTLARARYWRSQR